MYAVQTLNKISPKGIERLPTDQFAVGDEVEAPDALLLRSADLHSVEIPESVKAIARAGAGVNNILDEDPPLSSIVGTAPGNGNTYPQIYDAFGRYIFLGATVDF